MIVIRKPTEDTPLDTSQAAQVRSKVLGLSSNWHCVRRQHPFESVGAAVLIAPFADSYIGLPGRP